MHIRAWRIIASTCGLKAVFFALLPDRNHKILAISNHCDVAFAWKVLSLFEYHCLRDWECCLI